MDNWPLADGNITIMADATQEVQQHYSPIAQAGFTPPALYDKYRPSYPNHIIDHLLSSPEVVAGGTRILELGAGTGKLTEKLSACSANFSIFAVGPHCQMKDFLEQKRLRNVVVMDGLAQAIPLPDESIDCVLAAYVRWSLLSAY